MTGYTDDAKVMNLLAPLREIEPVPFAISASSRRSWVRRPVLVVAIVVVALAVTAVAIADGLGAFNGISSADRPQTSADVLDPQAVARLEQNCSDTPFWAPQCHLVLDSSRLIGQLPSGQDLYVVADTRGDLCLVEPSGMTCGTGLTRTMPFTKTSIGKVSFGVAIDGVTALSFQRSGQEITIPVKNNAWVYEGASLPEIGALTAHFDDGTTVTLSP